MRQFGKVCYDQHLRFYAAIAPKLVVVSSLKLVVRMVVRSTISEGRPQDQS